MKFAQQNKDRIQINIYVHGQNENMIAWTDHVSEKPDWITEKDIKKYTLFLRYPMHKDFIETKDFFLEYAMEYKLHIDEKIMNLYLIEKLITEWDFDDEDGKILPITAQSFLQIDSRILRTVVSDFVLQTEESV